MQSKRLEFQGLLTRNLRWLGISSFLLLFAANSAMGQFRDVTPRGDSEAESEQLSPEPLPEAHLNSSGGTDATEESDAELQPEPVPPAPEEPTADELAEEALQQEIEDTLVDDTGIRPLPFRGITAGDATEEEVLEKWGTPFREMKGSKSRMLKYQLEPFRQVDLTFVGGKVSSILIHLDGLLAAEHVEEELRMTKLQPTKVYDDYGRTIGLAYPERGVLLAYESSDPDALIAKIQLEPINPEPFVLRALNDRHFQYEANLNDLRAAVGMSANYAFAHWVRAEQFATVGRYHDALMSAAKASSIEPDNDLYLITRIRLMAENGNLEMALRETKHLLEQPNLKAEVEAAALSLLGRLVSMGLAGNHKSAMQYHLDAIDIAAKLVNDPVRDRRRLAKMTLIRSHLAIARNISMGDFQKQQKVVPKWLSRSRALIDEFVEHERGDRSIYLDLYRQILATAADIRNTEDPSHVIAQMTDESRDLIASANDEMRKKQIEWKLGAGLAEAVRLQRQRGEADEALQLADTAMTLLRTSAKRRQSTPEQTYLIGRLYFHTGSLHAVQREDHDEAILWYKKAEPLLADEQPTALLADPGTHGEIFISMGVSYWDFGDRQKAIDVTEFGTDYLQRAGRRWFVGHGSLDNPLR